MAREKYSHFLWNWEAQSVICGRYLSNSIGCKKKTVNGSLNFYEECKNMTKLEREMISQCLT